MIKYIVAPTIKLGNYWARKLKLNLGEVKIAAYESQVRGVADFTKENTLILNEEHGISKRVFSDGVLDIVERRIEINSTMMKEWIDLTYKPHIEESDDGICIFEFKAKTGKSFYVTADFKHNDDKGDRRDVFYDKDCPKCPLLYHKLIRFLSTEILYRGFSWEEARKAMG